MLELAKVLILVVFNMLKIVIFSSWKIIFSIPNIFITFSGCYRVVLLEHAQGDSMLNHIPVFKAEIEITHI